MKISEEEMNLWMQRLYHEKLEKDFTSAYFDCKKKKVCLK